MKSNQKSYQLLTRTKKFLK